MHSITTKVPDQELEEFNILYEKILINKIHEIYIIPRFVGAQQSSIVIDGISYPISFFLSFLSHLVEVNQYTLQEFGHDLRQFCDHPEDHHKIQGEDRYHSVHNKCLINIAKQLPGFKFFKELLPVSSRVFTIQQQDDEYPVSWPATYFVSSRGNASYLIRIKVDQTIRLDFQYHNGEDPDEDSLLELIELPDLNPSR